MVKSLEQLKDERDTLLRKKNAHMSLRRLAIRRKLERKQIQAEVKALKNPKSMAAKKTARRLVIKSSIALVRTGVAIGKHLGKVARENAAREKAIAKKARKKKGKSKRR